MVLQRLSVISQQAAFVLVIALAAAPLTAQDSDATVVDPSAEDEAVTQEPIRVSPDVDDEAIRGRLSDLLQKLQSRGWLRQVAVEVDGGIVVLTGHARSESRRRRAAELAGRIEGVTVVINDLEVDPPDVWDLRPVADAWHDIARSAIAAVPYFAVAVLILLATLFAARLTSFVAERLAARRIGNPLLRSVTVRLAAIAVIVLGLYLVLRTTGLTNLALTVLGGTGLFGLVMGFAFRNIAENFLCGVLLSLNQPFRPGDLVEIAGFRGVVEKVTTRGTWLLTLDGTYVRLPNARVYGEVIRNVTANPTLRLDFSILIGYADGIRRAQQAAVAALADHPEVLAEPVPLCLAEEPRSDGVALRVYFWIDSRRTSRIKVMSSAIRLVLRALRDAGFPPPDEGQKLLFPQGIDLRVSRRESSQPDAAAGNFQNPPEPAAVPEEGRPTGEAEDIQRTRRVAAPDAGTDLLDRNSHL